MTTNVAEPVELVWNNFNLFTSTKETPKEEEVKVQGKFPEWLKGTLYRNGPGANEVNDDASTSFNHAFDGFAFIQKYRLDGSNQKIYFHGSFIKSHTYTESVKQGRLATRQFGTDPCKSLFGRFQSLFKSADPSTKMDDTGVTIQMVNKELLALTENAVGNVLDPETLEYLGPLTALPYAKTVPSEILTLTTAHVMFDEKRQMTIGYASHASSKQHWLDVVFIYDDPQKDVEKCNDDDEAKWLNGNGRFVHITKRLSDRGLEYNRRVRSNTKVFRYPYDNACYMHSASMTEDYLILAEIPLHFSMYYAAWGSLTGDIVTNMFKWNGATMPTYFRVISLDTGKEIARIPGPAFFDFHHVNSFHHPENPKKILVDICAFDDHRIINELHLKPLRENKFPSGGGYLRRFELDLNTQTCTEPNAGARSGQGAYPISHANSLVPVQFELARINPNFIGKPYRYLYAVRAVPGRLFDAIVKLDAESKEQVAIWEHPCTSPSEPIFVPRPSTNSTDEDDGVVLTVILSQHEKKSFLLVLDAKNLKEIARADLPIHVPLSFHGNFYST